MWRRDLRRHGATAANALRARRSCGLGARDYAAAGAVQPHTTAARAPSSSTTRDTKDQGIFAGVVAATRQFHAIHGHFVIPAGFRVPRPLEDGADSSSDTSAAALWPAQFHGFPLGFKVKALLTNPKHRTAHMDIVDELEELGVPVDVDWRDFLWQNTTLKALDVYRKLHGDLLVPRNFTVPTGDPTWPRPTWGFRLGLRVMNMRQLRYEVTPTEAEDLEEIGFVWDVHDHVWRTRVLPALRTFKSLYDHCNVEQAFVVPEEDPWPEDTRGLALGHVVNTLRSPIATYAQQVQRDHEILDELGFAWDAIDDRWARIMLPALEAYTKEFGKGVRPHYTFVVPAESPWPKAAWYLPLGTAIYSIRNVGTYRHQVLRDADQLKALGWFQLLTEKWGIDK